MSHDTIGMLLGLSILIVYVYGFVRMTDWASKQRTPYRLNLWLLWICGGLVVTLISLNVLAGPGIEKFLRSYDDPVTAEKQP